MKEWAIQCKHITEKLSKLNLHTIVTNKYTHTEEREEREGAKKIMTTTAHSRTPQKNILVPNSINRLCFAKLLLYAFVCCMYKYILLPYIGIITNTHARPLEYTHTHTNELERNFHFILFLLVTSHSACVSMCTPLWCCTSTANTNRLCHHRNGSHTYERRATYTHAHKTYQANDCWKRFDIQATSDTSTVVLCVHVCVNVFPFEWRSVPEIRIQCVRVYANVWATERAIAKF